MQEKNFPWTPDTPMGIDHSTAGCEGEGPTKRAAEPPKPQTVGDLLRGRLSHVETQAVKLRVALMEVEVLGIGNVPVNRIRRIMNEL